MLKNLRWKLILLLSIISTVTLITGFLTALSISSAPPKEITHTDIEPPKETNELNSNLYNILVLGDSLAKGTGDEKGLGFSGYFSDYWKSKTSKEIKINNLAVNGDVSSGLLNIVQNPQNISYIKGSSMIFISIGGNEISKLKNMDITSSTTKIKNIEDTYLSNLKATFKIIRDNNPSSMVIFIGLYNPFGKDLTPDKVSILNDWNYQSQQLVSLDSNAIFIPTYDLFKYNLQNYLTVDNFHPNNSGYEAISNRIVEALKNYKA
ncbi:SGNH/GDSL hydrolase family protein [Clostridium saccharoperbutylacetonicum]|uniref:SGNH/GDSL hydrolase family protein n=1 Tax=Clostridium saccharoperbutylacetonicum TaxID=36745 RepID=UPI0009839CCD|nr:SGNH/GDSL hydrolase family protein [Clostridium saccharoperbutylacetonicum]AQR93183.1 spore germination lipase LipC [Clostridium saccharoperbutylacetonicum]NSB34600.1 lysophospholipase L1-like esterase [Clostridium saccharoperbutylacetonicum]